MAMPYANPYYSNPYGSTAYMQQMQPAYPNPMMQNREMQPYQPQQQQMQAVQNAQQQVQPMQAGQPVQGISPMSRPVTNIEEARAVAADFSGSPMIFPDISHNRVYVKRWDINAGVANFTEYAPVIYAAPVPEQEVVQDKTVKFATMENLNDMHDYIENLEQAFENLKAEVERLKKSSTSNFSKAPASKKSNVKDETDE